MNREPIRMLQVDAKWADRPYRVPGEDTTIGDSGCGPTAAASVLSSMTCSMYNPAQACQWAMDHGYKAKGQGTYYGFFERFFATHGIECRRLNGSNAYGNTSHPAHAEARALMRQGWYVIACMGRGTWTRSGHFVVAWWDGNKVEIMDPASTRYVRCHGDPDIFYREVKYYFAINAEQYNRPTAPSTYPVTWRVCATDGLNVRTGPGTDHAKAGKLAWGDDIQLIGRSGDWYQTPIGWISEDYVVPIPNWTPPAPKPKPVPKPVPTPEQKPAPDTTKEEDNMSYAQYTEYKKKDATETAGMDFSTWVTDDQKKAMKELAELGITDGKSPRAPVEREQLWLSMSRMMEVMQTKQAEAIANAMKDPTVLAKAIKGLTDEQKEELTEKLQEDGEDEPPAEKEGENDA